MIVDGKYNNNLTASFMKEIAQKEILEDKSKFKAKYLTTLWFSFCVTLEGGVPSRRQLVNLSRVFTSKFK